MEEIYQRLMNESRCIASRYEVPEFYRRFTPALAISRRIFFDNSLLTHCRELIIPQYMDNFGHGLQHATKVSIDAGAIVLLEGENVHIEDLIHWCNSRVDAKFQRISDVIIMETFPRNVAGKILKRELRGAYGKRGT